MKFFVPDAEPSKYEDLYATYADMCGQQTLCRMGKGFRLSREIQPPRRHVLLRLGGCCL